MLLQNYLSEITVVSCNISSCTKDFKNDYGNSNENQNSQGKKNQKPYQNDNRTTTTFANNVNNICCKQPVLT